MHSKEEIIATLQEPMIKSNSICRQLLGVCSALAVTGMMKTTLVMCVAVTIVAIMSSLLVSLLRNITPNRVRMIVQVLIIATFVIIVDLILKAFLFDTSKLLGPYVGLIITNCIIMGRCEAFAMCNPPVLAMVDGLGAGLGYSIVLSTVAFIRELFGTGTLFKGMGFMEMNILPAGFPGIQFMTFAPSAFIIIGLLIWFMNVVFPEKEN
jgi:Na+-transporting NADH:ubiquinone oxidoreductase subunit D